LPKLERFRQEQSASTLQHDDGGSWIVSCCGSVRRQHRDITTVPEPELFLNAEELEAKCPLDRLDGEVSRIRDGLGSVPHPVW